MNIFMLQITVIHLFIIFSFGLDLEYVSSIYKSRICIRIKNKCDNHIKIPKILLFSNQKIIIRIEFIISGERYHEEC